VQQEQSTLEKVKKLRKALQKAGIDPSKI